MSGTRYVSPWPGSLLLLAALASAEAQYPPSRGRTTSAVDQLFPDTASTAAPAQPGRLRELVCRGVAGLQLPIQQDPSPRNKNYVAVALAYQRNSKPAGAAYEQLEPGACSWNRTGDPTIPPEPGIVHFDLNPQGSAEVPDPTTLAVWLGDPRHYWLFYVDDATNVSISYGAYGGQFRVEGTRPKPTSSTATALRRERLRCRGGTGLAFDRRGRQGDNLVGMTLVYKVAFSAAGPVGGGLEPGTCAWADRTDARAEPGRIAFTTAGNAQLKQAQSGSAVDRSPTAAERWPDVHTIPAYLTDPAHYWTFTVSLADPDSALRHAAWMPTAPDPMASQPAPQAAPTTVSGQSGVGGAIGAKPPAGTGTTVSLPGGSTVGDRYTPGSGTSINPTEVFDIRGVVATAGLEGVAIRFEAAPNLAPTVTVASSAPVGADGSLRFDGQPLRLAVQGTPTGGALWRYTAASPTPLARGTRYWFIADAPEGPNSRHNQATGEFRTLAQRVKVGISQIDVISDGDTESPGDLWFKAVSCPDVLDGDLVGTSTQPVQWSEGRHQVGAEIASNPGLSAPDRFKVFITGIEDDYWLVSGYGSRHPFHVWFFCSDGSGSLEPRASAKAEWNAAVIDLDLRQYVGTTATQTFVRRSQPLREGSKVSFEVRGYVSVTRE